MAELLPHDVICPLCAEPMEDRRVGAMFWQDPKPALRYPLHPVNLAAIAALTLTLAILPPGPLQFVVAVPVLAIVILTAFAVFDQSGRGKPGPAGLPGSLARKRLAAFPGFFWTVLLYALPPALGWLSGSALLFFTLLAAAALALPAALMATAIDETPHAALDPTRIARLIVTLGKPYLVLAACAAVAAVAPAALLSPVSGLLPTPLVAGVLTLAYGYLALLGLRLTGGVLYQFRRPLCFAAGVDRIDRPHVPGPGEYEPAQALADARIQIDEGNPRQARMTIGQALTHHADHDELNECFDTLIRITGTDAGFRNHIERRLRRLVTTGRTAEAAELWLNNRKHLNGWLPRYAETRHHMALELERRGEHRVAVRLLLKLLSAYPRYSQLPEACLEAARMLETRLDDPAQAAKLRAWVDRRFPEWARRWRREHQQDISPQSVG